MRAAITAWGAVTAHGAGVATLAAALREGRTGVKKVTRFATAGLCSELAAESSFVTQGDRAQGLLAQAIAEAGLGEAGPPLRSRGALLGTTKGMLDRVLTGGEHDAIAPLAAYVARQVGAAGPARAIGAACASSSAAVGQALQLLEQGGCEEVVVAGVEALHAFVFAGFHALKALSPLPAAPFDGGRQGLSMGEAAVVLRLEPEARAKAMGRPALAFVEGFGTAVDAHDQTAPHPKGEGLFQACHRAVRSAGLTLEQIGRYHAHGTATPHNDRMEAQVVERLFGARPVPLTAIKGSVGHCLGAAGALDVLGCALALSARELWPVVGLKTVDPAFHLSAVLERRSDDAERALVATAGFGGLNTAVVVARGDASPHPAFGRPSPEGRRIVSAVITAFATWASGGARVGAAPAGGPGVKLGDWPEAPPLSRVHPRARRPHPQAKALVQLAAAVLGERRPSGLGVALGTSAGCLTPDLEFQRELDTKGKGFGGPSLFVYTLPTAPLGEVAIALGANGPGFTVNAGAASALTAVGLAAEEVAAGRAPAMLAAGLEWGTGLDWAAVFLLEPKGTPGGGLEVRGRQGFGAAPSSTPGDALALARRLADPSREAGKLCAADAAGFWAELEWGAKS